MVAMLPDARPNQQGRFMKQKAKKAKYTPPRLTAYGSVRNLTGGSATLMMDGMIMMAMD